MLVLSLSLVKRQWRAEAVSLWAVPDRARCDAAHGLPSIWTIGVAVAPITAVVVVAMVVTVVAVMVMVPVVTVAFMAVAFALALVAHLHDVVLTGELRQARSW
jgi:hypothetical protein